MLCLNFLKYYFFMLTAFVFRVRHSSWTAWSWRWRARSSKGPEELCIQWHRVTFQETWIFRHTVVGNLNHTCRKWCAECCCHQAFLCLMRLVLCLYSTLFTYESYMCSDTFCWELSGHLHNHTCIIENTVFLRINCYSVPKSCVFDMDVWSGDGLMIFSQTVSCLQI